MLFATYRQNKGTDGSFSKGRIYIGHGTGSCGMDTIDFSHAIFTDNNNENMEVDLSLEEFLFPDEVYAVCLNNKFEPWIKKGDIVTVLDGDDNSFKIKNNGFLNKKNFQILDLSVLFPGVYIRDYKDNCWKKVLRVDGSMFLSVEGDIDNMRAPDQFIFGVSIDGVLSYPLVEYIGEPKAEIKNGTTYRILWSDDKQIMIKNENKELKKYPIDNFSMDW